MGRPTISKAKRRQQVSLSICPEILEIARASGNSSKFFEESARVCQGVFELMQALIKGEAKRADVLEEIEDLVEIWKNQGEGPGAGAEVLPWHVSGTKT